MEKGQKLIPHYYVTKRNTILQILFTSLFAYVFIIIYRPFGSREWFDVSGWEYSIFSGLLVIAGMLVVMTSRLRQMLFISKKNQITVRHYLLTIAGEIFFMALIYALLEKFVLHDQRHFGFLTYLALQNTALILLIPYIISLLFIAWQEKSVHFNRLTLQLNQNINFISFRDDKGILRMSLKADDLLYIESSDNYVSIKYLQNKQPKAILIRNTLKNLEKEFEHSFLLRCHRSFMVNIKKVNMIKIEGPTMKIILESPGNEKIPVSRRYSNMVRNIFDSVEN